MTIGIIGGWEPPLGFCACAAGFPGCCGGGVVPSTYIIGGGVRPFTTGIIGGGVRPFTTGIIGGGVRPFTADVIMTACMGGGVVPITICIGGGVRPLTCGRGKAFLVRPWPHRRWNVRCGGEFLSDPANASARVGPPS